MIAAIVAVDGNNGIGFDGELLERIPEDMKRFRALTEDNIVIMGRKTWDSLPSQPLQNRDNLIISSKLHLDYSKYHDYVVGVQNMESAKFALTMLKQNYLSFNDKDVFIIGGGSIYE